MFRKKRGALLGIAHERSILLARRVGDDGSVAWSGPVFCRGRAASLGLTMGAQAWEQQFSAAVRNLASRACSAVCVLVGEW